MSLSPVVLHTSDGCRLLGDVYTPDSADSLRGLAVVLHPHPLYGGDRHNPVVDAVFRELPEHGIGALRFDFRGVGGSSGSHGDGIDERLDVGAALNHLEESFPGLPVFVVGYSFGSMVGLSVDWEDVRGWVAIAPPFALAQGALGDDVARTGASTKPKLLIVAGHDQFTPEEQVRAATAEWVNTTIELLPSADHFLMGHTARVATLTAEFLSARI